MAVRAAEAAGAAAMSYFGPKGISARRKADLTPVTDADIAAEKAALEVIRAAFPTHAYWGEESGRSAPASDVPGQPTWVIDPIDGTKQFMRGIPFFATLIALTWNGQPVAGVSFAPALGEMLVAARGMGATFNGQPTHVSSMEEMRDSYVAFGHVIVGGNVAYADAIRTIEQTVLGCRGYGDFYGYHLVARGLADAMLEPQVAPWDVAPLKLIVEEAGGTYSNFADDRRAFGGTSLASNGHLHASLCQLLHSLNAAGADNRP